MTSKSGKKLYIVGVDSAPLWIIKDFQKRRRLDGFSKFLSDGVLTDLESTIPPMTGPSWPSIYTGYRPGEHGVPEFFKLESSYTKTLVYYDPKIKQPFWERLASHGLKSLVVTPAMVVKPTENKKIDMITGYPLPARFSSSEMKDIAESHSFAGEPEIEAQMRSGEYTLSECSDRYLEGINSRASLSKELIEKKDYDLVFVCFTEQDRIQHFSLNLPKWQDYVLPMYEGISDFLTWLQRRAEREKAMVMLVSDHGAQPVKEKFLINGWLINNGAAHLKRSLEKGMAGPGSAMKYNLREKMIMSNLRKKVYYKLPTTMRQAAKNVFEKSLSGTSAEDLTLIHDFDYDMKRTKAFASLSKCPMTMIFINDDRFDSGIVKQGEKKALKRKLMSDIRKIKDEKGRSLIVDAWDADDYYEGTDLFIAPDIIVEIKEGYILDPGSYLKSGGLETEPEIAKRGDHLKNGIFGLLSYGSRLNYESIKRKHLYVYNIEPTVMEYFGFAPGNDKRYKSII
ncbi:MAG TPA: alkaline phosphatase family protein [Candidatus Acidoferrum sp.]|nr:alkaline phosphatase family protein [Candidatus Acidoferrum sp.]